jgi:hypothetical protein
MKKTTVFIAALLFVIQGFAQDDSEGFGKIRRGSLTIAGSIYGSYYGYSTDAEDYSSLNIRFNPSVGIFVANNFELGLSLLEGYGKSTSEYNSGSNTSTYESGSSLTGLSCFGNVYFGSGRIKPFIGAELGVFVENSTYKSD